jgi:hypothetical protein
LALEDTGISDFETLETTNPETQSHIPEDLSPQFSTLRYLQLSGRAKLTGNLFGTRIAHKNLSEYQLNAFYTRIALIEK